MYMGREVYYVDDDILETLLMQENMMEDGHVWILGLGLFKVIGLYGSQLQSLHFVLSNKCGMLMVQIPCVATVLV